MDQIGREGGEKRRTEEDGGREREGDVLRGWRVTMWRVARDQVEKLKKVLVKKGQKFTTKDIKHYERKVSLSPSRSSAGSMPILFASTAASAVCIMH